MNAMTEGRAVTTAAASSPGERPAGQISQKTLAKYQRLQEKQKKIRAKLDRMRKTLLAAESFEPGPLVCYRDHTAIKRFSHAKLSEILSPETFSDILNRLPLTTSWWVKVRKRVWRKG